MVPWWPRKSNAWRRRPLNKIDSCGVLEEAITILHILNKVTSFSSISYSPERWLAPNGDFAWAREHKVKIQGYGDVDVARKGSSLFDCAGNRFSKDGSTVAIL
jgi:hypothetical protein